MQEVAAYYTQLSSPGYHVYTGSATPSFFIPNTSGFCVDMTGYAYW